MKTMAERAREARVAGEVTRELREERDELLATSDDPLAWQSRLEDELEELFVELGVDRGRARAEIRNLRQADDPEARLEGYVSLGRTFRELGELSRLAAELELG